MDEKKEELQEKLRQFFEFQSFKSEDQYYATLTVMSTENRDVIINLPPGTGKTICFQLPTMLCDEKITIVIVPDKYIGLEQILFLKKHNIESFFAYSKLNIIDESVFLEKLVNKFGIKFIYVTPYMVMKSWFLTIVKALYTRNLISFIVVDEAQHLSEHFGMPRRIYSDIYKLQDICPGTIFIALTSVGTENIITDIKNSLKLRNPHEISHMNWQLPNVYLQVKFKDILVNPFDDIKTLVNNFIKLMQDFCGIISCSKLEETVFVAEELTKIGIPTAPYSLKLKAETRNQNKEDWMNGKIRMLAVTHNFGMRFNKPSLGCIIHWSIPLKIEQYYQHIGKHLINNPGILCRVYFGIQDLLNVQMVAFGRPSYMFEEYKQMIYYCMSTECRHMMYTKYFGITVDPCGNACDFCEDEVSSENNLKNFQLYMNQRYLLPKLKDKPILQVYNIQKTRQTVKNLKPLDRYNLHEALKRTILKNYESSSCINKPDIETKYLIHMARGLEYFLFTTSQKEYTYNYRMGRLISEIYESIGKKELTNYILNYKYES